MFLLIIVTLYSFFLNAKLGNGIGICNSLKRLYGMFICADDFDKMVFLALNSLKIKQVVV